MRRRYLLRHLLVVALVLTVVLPAPTSPAVGESDRPDVLVVLLDDLRSDELAPLTFLRDGSWTRFTDAAVAVPMCCPSRASLLTGRYSSDVGVRGNSEGMHLDDRRTLATAVRAAGYRTGLAGKYLNGYPWTRPDTYVPPGWDHWRAFGSAAERAESRGTYSADYLAATTRRFLDATPADRPFFFYLSYGQPHLPAVPAPRHATAPVTLPPWPPGFNEADVSDKPPAIRRLPLAGSATVDRWLAERTAKARSLMAVDEGVRSVLEHLRRSGRLDRTVVVVTSDNGYGFGSHRVEAKAFPYEELVTVPFFVRHPGRPGGTVTQQVSLLDVAPTVAGMARTSVPGARGISLEPVLRDPGATLPRTWVFLEGPRRENPWQAVRSERLKYVEHAGGARELYDLRVDPHELRNVVDDPAYADRARWAASALAALRP